MHFDTSYTKEKDDLREKDKEIRQKLLPLLKNSGVFSSKNAEKIVNWDPYDSNTSANWFDPEWMFGIKNGFDVVIANPPYVRQEKIKQLKPLLQKQGYEVYNSTSDLYTYFYEKSYNILKNNGHLCFISSNKWMRAKYGEKLRKFFKQRTLLKQIIDFNGHQVFDATVDTNILLFQKENPQSNHILNVVNIQSDFIENTALDIYSQMHNLSIVQKDIDSRCFTFADDKVMKLKVKIEEKGIPLKDWDVKIYRGVVTGFNEAFIIDTETKERLCLEDPKSAEVIKLILRGRDIGKYYYKWADLWLIFTRRGINIEKYSAIKKHLLQYKENLEPGTGRKPGIYKWYEIQDNTAYYPDFEKEKIVWAETAQEIKMSFVPEGIYLQKTCFLITGKNLKYIQAILNSSLLDYYTKQSVYKLGEKGIYLSKYFFEQLPIPKISESEQQPFIDLVDKILAITKVTQSSRLSKNHKQDVCDTNSEKQAKVKEYERQIDQMVYQLYKLNHEEIKIVEGKNNLLLEKDLTF